MSNRDVRVPRILLSFIVLSIMTSHTDVLFAASSKEHHDKRHGVPAPSQPEGHADPDLLPLWAAFLGRTAGPVSVTWSQLWGTPKAVYGTLTPPTTVSEASARQFLSSHAALFKLDPSLRDLNLSRTVTTLVGTLYGFSQSADGVPVYGAEVAVQFDKEGRIVALTNTAVPNVQLVALSPTVKDTEAVIAAREAVAKHNDDDPTSDVPDPTTRLVIYAETGTPTLAWEVVVPTPGPRWQVFVHAQKATVLAPARDLNRYVTGTGQVFLVNAVVATRNNTLHDDKDAASAVPASAYRTVRLLGLDGSGYLDGTYASSNASKRRVSSSSQTFVYDRSSNGFSETMGYYYFDYAQRYIQSLGFASVNNRQQVFSIDRYTKDNSFYDSSTKTITLGTGGVDDAEDAEVMWHEYGHSMQDNQVPGFGTSTEADALGEGFGDYWAGTVGAQLSGGFQDVCLADWDSTSYSTTVPPCLRRLDGTKHYPEAIDGEPHDDGEIWSAALWQIRGAIGARKADTVIIEHHFSLTRDTSLNQAANALVNAAIALHYSTPDVNSIRTILINRGFAVTL